MNLDFIDIDFSGWILRLSQRLKRFQFGVKAQLAFLEDFYLLVNDGIPANRAIEMMVQVTSGLERDVALSIAQKISQGQPLAEGMREWFAVNVVEIIRVGEEGGVLTDTTKSAINTLSQRSSNIGALLSAILYPSLIIVLACCIIIYLNDSVFIQFKLIKPVDMWPQAGRTLIDVANFIESWWWAALVFVIAFGITLRKIMLNYTGELRPILDRFPPFSFYRKIVAARMMETMGLLIANGVVFKNAIKVMLYQATPYMASHLVLMEHLLGMGKGNVADVLSTGLIEEKDILRLRVMAEVKGFEHGLIRMGIHGAEEIAHTMNIVSKVVGGILLIIGAMLIIIIVRGIYLTGMSMGSV